MTTNLAELVTFENTKAWLEKQPETEPVGIPDDPCRCLIASYLWLEHDIEARIFPEPSFGVIHIYPEGEDHPDTDIEDNLLLTLATQFDELTMLDDKFFDEDGYLPAAQVRPLLEGL